MDGLSGPLKDQARRGDIPVIRGGFASLAGEKEIGFGNEGGEVGHAKEIRWKLT